MKRSSAKRLKEANGEAIERILKSRPVLVGVRPAREVIPGMHERLFLHSGPPIEWNRMCGPVRGAAIGAMLYEGFAQSESDAAQRLDNGEIEFSPTHHHRTVSPMAGIVSPSMPVFIVKNKTFGNEAYCTINEGVGRVKTLRFGANSKEVIERLRWMREILAPALDQGVRICGEIDLKTIIAEALRRGDECHNRNKSATIIFFRTITSPLFKTELDKNAISSVLDFVGGNDHFFLNLSMASSKATMDAAHGVPSSTVVTVMTTNGVEFGIRVSGLGDEWFTAPAPHQTGGKLFEGYSRKDANPVFGDSYISEPAGIGAFAMAASPAISEFVGSTPSFGIQLTKRMYKITLAKHSEFKIPYLDYEGTPTGICLEKVVRTGIVPVVNTGVAHKKPGIGQIGAGIAKAPMGCFRKAARKFKEKYAIQL
jgi:hypothetical protein